MEHKGRYILIIGLLIITLAISSAGTTFSYISTVINPSTGSTTDSQGNIVDEPVLDFDWTNGKTINAGLVNSGELLVEKTFKVNGTIYNSTQKNYEIDLNITTNTYADNALVYTLTATNDSSNGATIKSNTIEKPIAIKNGQSNIVIGTGSFSGPVQDATHTYVLRIYRNTTDTSQYGSASLVASLDKSYD